MQKVIKFFQSQTFYSLNNEKAARHLANRMICNKNDCIILPYVDHPGPLTQAILGREFRSLTILERDKNKMNLFQDYVHDKFPDRNVLIYNEDAMNLMNELYDTENQKKCSDIVRNSLGQAGSYPMEKSNHDPSAQVKVLVPLMKKNTEVHTMKNIFYQVAFRLGFCTDTFVQYHLLMSDRQFRYLVSKPAKNLTLYRSHTVLFNTLFNIDKLETYDMKEDFGISASAIRKTKTSDYSIHLVRMEPNVSLVSRYDPCFLAEFRFFVVQSMFHPKRRVVIFVDNWFDTAREGKDFGYLGITTRTRIGDMSKEQFLQLFCALRDLPNYPNSTFVSAAKQCEQSLAILDQISYRNS